MCSTSVFIIRKSNRNDSLQLKVDQTHDICDDNHFIVYLWSSTEHDFMSESDFVVATIIWVEILVSNLELSDSSVCVQTRWIATMWSRCSFQVFSIQLDFSLSCWNEWRATLREQSLSVTIDQNRKSVSFVIWLSSESKYEALNESDSKLDNLSIMMHDQMNTNLICDVMKHLINFKVIRNLFNNAFANSFQESFSIQIKNTSEKIFQSESWVRLKHDKQSYKLKLENKKKENFYVNIYDMRLCWQVKSLLAVN